jgi:hypothetical protein
MTFFEDCEYTKFDGSRTYKAKTYRKIFNWNSVFWIIKKFLSLYSFLKI